MFDRECGGCGAGLRARDEKCRLCGRTVTRSTAGSSVQSFADAPPRAMVAAAIAAPTATVVPSDGADLALTAATPSERRKPGKLEKPARVPRSRKGAEPPLLVVTNAVPLIEAETENEGQTEAEEVNPEITSAEAQTEATEVPMPEMPVVDVDLPALAAADTDELLA